MSNPSLNTPPLPPQPQIPMQVNVNVVRQGFGLVPPPARQAMSRLSDAEVSMVVTSFQESKNFVTYQELLAVSTDAAYKINFARMACNRCKRLNNICAHGGSTVTLELTACWQGLLNEDEGEPLSTLNFGRVLVSEPGAGDKPLQTYNNGMIFVTNRRMLFLSAHEQPSESVLAGPAVWVLIL